MSSENKLSVVENTLPAISVNQVMEEMGISTGDLIIPTVALMQNTSEKVGMGEAAFGDLINSQTGEKLGDFNKGLEILPLRLSKSWVVYDTGSGPLPKYLRVEPMTPANERLPWEDVENGVKIRRDISFDFHVLSVADIAKGEVFPYVVRFRRTSLAAGKALVNIMMKNALMGKEPFFKTVMLKPMRQKTDTNVYGVFSVTPVRTITEAERACGNTWVNLMRVKNVRAEEDTTATETVVTSSPVEVKSSEKKTDLY